MPRKVVTDVAMGRTFMFSVTQAQKIWELRILPVKVVEETEKLRVIHDLIFGDGVTVREERETGKQEVYMEPRSKPGNADTD